MRWIIYAVLLIIAIYSDRRSRQPVSIFIYPPCPCCNMQLELECEWEDSDPSVGIWGGLIPPDVPNNCPNEDCEANEGYSDDQRAALQREIDKEVDSWEPDDEPDYKGPIDDDFDYGSVDEP